MMNEKECKCIDFDHSFIGWKLKSGSVGLFKIDSVLKEKNTQKINYLAKTVMAGNVYGKSILPIIPNYNFQWFTDGKKRLVFRKFENNEIKIDNKGKEINKYLINIKKKNKKKISLKNLIKDYLTFNRSLSCKINLENQICEFPINHINSQIKNNCFQVETGPILIKKKKNFISAFTFFNDTNNCQIVWNYPTLGGKIEKLKVKINFYINA